MDKSAGSLITVSAIINSPVGRVWEFWTKPYHIIRWNHASDDWLTSWSENDLRPGGGFLSRMEARDGSFGFDFSGVYNFISENKQISLTLDDGRKVDVFFTESGSSTEIKETFEAENENSVELQRQGWQAILDNFRNYAAGYGKREVLIYETVIKAPADVVYKTMLEHESYAGWTSVFNPTSRYSGNWEKGSRMFFIGTDSNGKEGGMVSKIRENLKNRYVSIEHYGILKEGKEVISGEEVEAWKGFLENYSFSETGGKTKLTIDIDTNQEFRGYFTETWPKALEKLKLMCENN